jgi:hypothetical protein
MSLAIAGNYLLRNLFEPERLHPAIVSGLDDRCFEGTMVG